MKSLVTAALTGVFVLGAFAPLATAAEPVAPCSASRPGGPLAIDATCVDPTYGKPVIDKKSDMDGMLLVEGHFEGPGTKFRIYLPAKTEWKGPEDSGSWNFSMTRPERRSAERRGALSGHERPVDVLVWP